MVGDHAQVVMIDVVEQDVRHRLRPLLSRAPRNDPAMGHARARLNGQKRPLRTAAFSAS